VKSSCLTIKQLKQIRRDLRTRLREGKVHTRVFLILEVRKEVSSRIKRGERVSIGKEVILLVIAKLER